MSIGTQPYSKRKYTNPSKVDLFGWAGRNMVHQESAVLVARRGFFKCPKCGGAAIEEVDGSDLVITCCFCGYETCNREPDGVAWRHTNGR